MTNELNCMIIGWYMPSATPNGIILMRWICPIKYQDRTESCPSHDRVQGSTGDLKRPTVYILQVPASIVRYRFYYTFGTLVVPKGH